MTIPSGERHELEPLKAAAVRIATTVLQFGEAVAQGEIASEISAALERDKFLTAEEAKDFGLIDKVVEKRN